MSARGTILLMAGGTGGHVFPALATAEHLRQQGYQIEWLGSQRGIENRLVPEAGIRLHSISVTGLRGKGKLSLLMAPFKLLRALWQAWQVIRQIQPVAVLGMGGFASGPGGVAAWMLRKPLLIHEQNAIPGLTNRLLARFADRVMEAFPGAFESRAQALETGNPVRSSIGLLPEPKSRYDERQGPLRLLVVGGSLGAQAINQCVVETLAALPEAQRPQLWHQTGANNLEQTLAVYAEAGIELNEQTQVVPFIDDMQSAYGWADLVICRAGALTISELAMAGVASVLVPYPFAVDDHQTANARYLSEHQAAVLVPQPELDKDRLQQLLQQWNNRDELSAMAQRAHALATPDATTVVAQQCQEYASDG